MKDDKIIIKRSKNADTRTAEGEVTKKELLQQTYSHIDDVNNVGNFLADKFREQIKQHDHTKVEGIEGFPEEYRPYLRVLQSKFPNWRFTALYTGLDWNYVIDNENVFGKNLVPNLIVIDGKIQIQENIMWR